MLSTAALPAWLPAAGTVADLTTNTINGAAGQVVTGIWSAWSGAAWAPWWGAYGSMIAAGGGHADGSNNDIYRIDIETRLVTKIKNAATVFLKTTGERANDIADGTGNGLVNPGSTGWMWSDTDPDSRTVQVGEPFTAHFYSHLLAVPPTALAGRSAEAPNGWLYTPGRDAMPNSGQRVTKQAHLLAMGVQQLWELHGSGVDSPYNAEYGGAAYDPTRGRVWYLRGGPVNTLRYRPFSGTGAEGTQNVTGPDLFGYYMCVDYWAAQDILLIYGGNGVNPALQVVDLATNVSYVPTKTGTPPVTTASFAFGWSDTWQCVFYYPGDGTNTIHFLKPTGNPRTAAWAWTTQTVTGTVRAAYGNPSYNRIRHAPALGNCLIWGAKTAEPVQIIHLASAP